MTPVHLYHARRPYLPLLASAIHLGLGADGDSFMAAGLRHDWQAAPLFIAGADADGSLVCCLAHGRRRDLYCRTLEGLGGVFGVRLNRLDLDAALAAAAPAERLRAVLAAWLPAAYGRRCYSAVGEIIRPLLYTPGAGRE